MVRAEILIWLLPIWLAAVPGCALVQAPPTRFEPDLWDMLEPLPPSNDCVLSAATDRACYTRGQEVYLKVTVTNHGRNRVLFANASCGIGWPAVEVQCVHGPSPRLTEYAQGTICGFMEGGGGVLIDPGASFTYTLRLTMVFNLESPGEYVVHVRDRISEGKIGTSVETAARFSRS